nr:uncharacterized protein LOC107429887 isoform X2 [Ziziphus jujuba var. spinosa]
MKHASARNIIERCFGVLKMRWAILRSPSFYPITTQIKTITACCLIHNLIRREMTLDPGEVEYDRMENVDINEEEDIIGSIASSDRWTNWRDELANQMFAMEAGGSSNDNRWGESRRTWSRGEEEALLVLLDEAVASGQRCDTGAFKPGTLNMIERKLAEMCPNSGLRATPHIESKLKKWKKQYGIIYDMLNKSGFGWNDTLKCVEIDSDDAWKAYVQSNPSAKSWRDKPFPIYERLANIFGKDRATGHGAQTPIDLVNDINMEPDNDQFDDVGSPMSMNQTHSQLPTQSQLRGKRKAQSKDVDIVSGLNNVADKFIDKLATQLDKLEKSDINYPQYLAMELDRLGFPITDNLKISKAMRSDPSNVEVFKIIKTDAQKIEFARGFLDN